MHSGVVSWGQGRGYAGGEQGADPYLSLPPPSHPGLSHLNFSTSLCTTLFPPTPTIPALTHGVQNFEDDVYKLRGTCILQPGGQPSLKTQGEACHQPSSHPTFTRTPGPHNCSGLGSLAFSQSKPRVGWGSSRGRSWSSMGCPWREERTGLLRGGGAGAGEEGRESRRLLR